MASESVWTAIGQAVAPAAVAVAAYAATIVASRVKERNARRKDRYHEPFETVHHRDIVIRDVLSDLRFVLQARRAFLARVHNGEQYLDGSDILKYSWTHEVVEWGMAYQAEHRKNVLTSTMTDEWELVHEDGPGFRVVADMPPCKAKWLFEQAGATSVARYAVRKGKTITGFVGCDFGEGVPQPPVAIDRMEVAARRIETVIAGIP